MHSENMGNFNIFSENMGNFNICTVKTWVTLIYVQ